MNKFIKDNWIKIAAGVIVVFCFFIIYLLPKVKQANLVNQEKCSNKAEEFYLKNKDNSIAWLTDSDYTNHFNKYMGKCFVLIKGGNLNVEYDSSLYDVYENKKLGSVHTLMDKDVGCGLEIGNSYKECGNFLKENSSFSAIAEFNNLAKVYMEN